MTNALLAAVVATLLAFGLGACSEPIPTAEFEALKAKICDCKDAVCAGTLADDLVALKKRGGAPEDADAARTLLTEATSCAAKLDRQIGDKITAALRK